MTDLSDFAPVEEPRKEARPVITNEQMDNARRAASVPSDTDALRALADKMGFDLSPTSRTSGMGNALWYQCWETEGDRTGPRVGCPPFQSSADTSKGQYVHCPTCDKQTVKPLEGMELEIALRPPVVQEVQA
jgi:hypothetical protein